LYLKGNWHWHPKCVVTCGGGGGKESERGKIKQVVSKNEGKLALASNMREAPPGTRRAGVVKEKKEREGEN
jgi:hypothetical protein